MLIQKSYVFRVIHSIEPVFEKAQVYYRNGEYEDAFLLYKRVSYMCDMAQKKRDFDRIKNSPVSNLLIMT